MKKIRLGLFGLGNIGTGVARLLNTNKEIISARLGAELELKRASDLDITRDFGVKFAPGVLTTDSDSIVNDPEIDIVIELIGGTGVAKALIEKSIAAGKHVVTANKALLAKHGKELFPTALQKGVCLSFEASVGGCIPIVKTIRESLVANRISAFTGILNGTCNYILTRITEEGIPFDEALAGAQAEGYAEADPALDVEGHDTAHKLAILSSLAYGMEMSLDDIYVEGISGISPVDIEFAQNAGYTIKLLAISKYDGQSAEARVHPAMIPKANMLSNVSGSLNAVSVTGDAVGEMMLYGYGAGMMPTASAVLADAVDIARDILAGGATRIPGLSFMDGHMNNIPIRPIDEITTGYYLRLAVMDRPGVLSKISGILGDRNISLKSVVQTERKLNGAVPLFMLTHPARESMMKKAIEQISALDMISGRPVLIRIEEPESL
ncbi:MAG: homoserine dehydrogenase [Deltaproteobacteria bacterium]|nr:homoserine dehydrogenase [Deltaproteobacteria bacterium]